MGRRGYRKLALVHLHESAVQEAGSGCAHALDAGEVVVKERRVWDGGSTCQALLQHVDGLSILRDRHHAVPFRILLAPARMCSSQGKGCKGLDCSWGSDNESCQLHGIDMYWNGGDIGLMTFRTFCLYIVTCNISMMLLWAVGPYFRTPQ